MNIKRTALVAITITAALVLVGCAPQANQIGSFVPGPIGVLIVGLLQGAFILWVALINLLSYLIPWGHYDLYQDGLGVWYDVGFFIGLAFGAGVGFFGFRLFSSRRAA